MASKLRDRLTVPRFLPLVLGFALCICSVLPAQQPNEETEVASRHAVERADTSSPRATLRSFLQSTNELYDLIQESRIFDLDEPEHRALGMRIVDCLDTSPTSGVRP